MSIVNLLGGIVLIFLSAFGCSSSRERDRPDIDGAKLLVELSDAERVELCEWRFEISLASSGTDFGCGEVVAEGDLEECVMGYLDLAPTCSWTVEENALCVSTPNRPPCDEVAVECVVPRDCF
ncbi:MAG: hypothetical protein AAGF12_00945 [Myxococcota bacterium]